MAHENIQLIQSNFCTGPQAGTICTIDTTNPQTILRMKDTGGSTIKDLTLSSNILTDNIRLEYVGPRNMSGLKDDLTFFTFEKVNSSTCIIKRWQTRLAYSELLLKEQVVKSTSGNEIYDVIDFAVEYYYRSFTKPNEYYNYLDMDSTTNVKNGTRFFVGPSSDTTNLDATETVTVSHIVDYIGGKRVYLTSPLQYQYAIGDLITFYSHVYVYSSIGYANDTSKGTLFKLDGYSWLTDEIDTKGIYKRVTASRWCPMIGAIASVMGTNMLFVRPYDYYINWKSMFLNNVEEDNNSTFQVYDVIFDEYSIYKLQKKITLRDDEGIRTTSSWDQYNYQEDTLLPYSNSVVEWVEQSIVTGYNKNIDINIQVRDQFHVGLRDVTVNCYKSGDTDALFDPLSGLVTTDIDGKAVIDYRSGHEYTGHTEVTSRAQGGSSSTGSSFVWTGNNIISYPDANPAYVSVFTLEPEVEGYVSVRQVSLEYKNYIKEYNSWEYPYTSLFGKSFFTAPGGDWIVGGIDVSAIEEYLPMLYLGERQKDSPRGGSGYGFEVWPFPGAHDPGPFFIGNRITLLEEFESVNNIKSLTNYLMYSRDWQEDIAEPPPPDHFPYVIVLQPDETDRLQLSQLKLSLHTHWIDGVAYDELWTYANIDQFVFVEDAVPKFWSEKNPVDTDIWIRLRPYAFSLDMNTLKMWVREVSYLGDTGYYEVTNGITMDTFDAGSGMLGIEVTYDPPQDFLYESLIYVRIEVYDEAYIPNFIYVEYWFEVTPDYTAPYLLNLNPGKEDINVPIDSTVYFEVKDVGTGIDIDSLEGFLNSRLMRPEDLNIQVVSKYHIKVTYTPSEDLYFDKTYKVTVKVQDTSPNQNKMVGSYRFYTVPSTGVFITDPNPGVCKRGMGRFQDVSAVVLADGNGVDRKSLRMQVFNKDVHPNILPIIYRIS